MAMEELDSKHDWFKRAVQRSALLEREDTILQRAADVKQRVNDKMGRGASDALTSKPLPAFPEPKRNKVHWDYLMDEMVWLAKEFQKERKWKRSQSKKFARIVERSKLDIESRKQKKVLQDKQAIRKKAANLSQMVMEWWSKVERIVVHKRQYEIEKIEKNRLDKRLDALVAKTERCSKKLAMKVGSLIQPSQEKVVSKPKKEVNFESNESEESPKAPVNNSRSIGTTFSDEENDVEYNAASDEEDAVDDEQTIMEEERVSARDRNYLKRQKVEIDDLKKDSELPIEELLKKYHKGYAESLGESEDDEIADMQEDSPAKPEEDAIFSEEKNDMEYEQSSDTEVDDEQTLDEEEALARREGNVKAAEELELEALKQEGDLPLEQILGSYQNGVNGDSSSIVKSSESDLMFKEEENDMEYEQSSDSEPDDEKTLDEEEALARREGSLKDQEALELEALKQESEVPIEHLMSQYQPSTSYDSGEECKMEDNGHKRKRNKDRQVVDTAMKDKDINLVTEVEEYKLPFLLKYSLRDYQQVGLQWLATLGEKSLNGILADEMGLGKTIQTIALLADLACRYGYWGPHLIVVPTSVLMNWEMEFKKWCPAFKILTYFGTAKERHQKRQGWSKLNSFHVCLTTYTLILQDKNMFRRKKWDYLILDEAHMIKNWQSQRWQTLLRFHARRRILLTGTPLQNNLMELWSLMHFLMPKLFESHDEFKEWFNNPLTSAVEGQAALSNLLVRRLHGILRPFILRRLKVDVEKQLPGKFEHIIYCKLSKRQRNLYEDYVGNADTKSTLASGNYFGIFNVLMQLRKVCNHPDLFEGRAIRSAFDVPAISYRAPIIAITDMNVTSSSQLCNFGLICTSFEGMTTWEFDSIRSYEDTSMKILEESKYKPITNLPKWANRARVDSPILSSMLAANARNETWRKSRMKLAAVINKHRCSQCPIYGKNLLDLLKMEKKEDVLHRHRNRDLPLVVNIRERVNSFTDIIENFLFIVPKARTTTAQLWCSHPRGNSLSMRKEYDMDETFVHAKEYLQLMQKLVVRQRLFFPDRRLIQFDCGKLQQLAKLLIKLKSGGHRVLIFTQMSKMLDILESFLNLYAYTYLRLDGTTKPEQRQAYTQRFNTDEKIFAFILSTRSGGVGINLTGADTVVFYDSDWNPAMDHQAQDRCHRIGQTREVHIYRLVTKHTVEENIMRKSNQKRHLDHLAIQSGAFNVDSMLSNLSPQDLMMGQSSNVSKSSALSASAIREALNNAEDMDDRNAAQVAEKEARDDLAEFVSEGPTDGTNSDKEAAHQEGQKEETANEEHVIDFKYLESLLDPVDLYAMRFYESLYPFNAYDYVKVEGPAPTENEVEGDEDTDIQEFSQEDLEELNICDDWDPEGGENIYKDLLEGLPYAY